MVRVLVVWLALATVAAAQRPFRIEVVDAATGRGVPLVELETVHHVTFVTDSHGLCAVDEPELIGRRVWFHVRSHGYEHPADGFGYRGFACEVVPGGAHVVRLPRVQIAERLYRVTGAGIYRDTVLLGEEAPIRAPLVAGGVLGCDSVVNAIHRGRLFWFWGDTNRAAYPLGNFAVSGATSRLPRDGGLRPGVGVDLDHFVGDDGFARRLCRIDGPGPVWIAAPMVVDDGAGGERMFAHYARMKDLGTRHEHGIVAWDDARAQFEKVVEFPLDAPLHPSGHALRVAAGGRQWFVFPSPYPTVRVPADAAAIVDVGRYEAFTCLPAGARFGDGAPPVARGPDGAPDWAWRADTDAVTPARAARTPGAAWLTLRDVETGNGIQAHGGTLHWNPYRGRWIAIVLEAHGRSMLGEVWFAEADTPLGPFGYARRIVTHERYSFYNVKQHPYFDEADGRVVHFEGTYTATFSGNPVPTPRYDYNQVMYRLDLADPRLELPVPVYAVGQSPGVRWLTREGVAAAGAWGAIDRVTFHALPPLGDEGEPAFRTLPVDREAPGTVLLFRWTRGGDTHLAVDGEAPDGAGWQRGANAVGRVWTAPSHRPPLWPDAVPVVR